MARILALVCLMLVSLAASNETLDCLLIWKRLSLGDPVPSEAFLVSHSLPTSGHVARKISTDNWHSGGRFSNGIAFIVDSSGSALNLTSDYEILTNPHGCSLKWVENGAPTQPHIVTFGDGNLPIGRGVIQDSLLSGPVIGNRLQGVTDDLDVKETEDFDILTAYSPGLSLELTDFVFMDESGSGSEEYLGVDMIQNDGNFELRQTVTMKQRIFESVTTAISSMSERTHDVKLEANAELNLGNGSLSGSVSAGIELSFGWKNSNTNGKKTHKEFETWVEVTREVIVPPFTAVTVCSTIQMARDFKVNYVAKGRYSAPGIKASKILEILKSEPEGAKCKEGCRIEGNTVVVTESGEMAGNLGMSTRFIVVPVDSFEGCTELGARNSRLRHLRRL